MGGETEISQVIGQGRATGQGLCTRANPLREEHGRSTKGWPMVPLLPP